MTRYTVEYRRFCGYSNKWREWTIYSVSDKKNEALESYARHVSSYPSEQCRLCEWPEPDDILFVFDPNPEEQEEEAA